MTPTHTCPNCFHPLENQDTLRLNFLEEDDADLECFLMSEGRDIDGWWFNGKSTDGFGNTPREAIDDAIQRKALYSKKENIKPLQGYSGIWKCTEDTKTVDRDFGVGYYYVSEDEYLNGPYPTLEDAINNRILYWESLNAHLDMDDSHWDIPEGEYGR